MPARPADQPGVRHAAAAIGVEQRLLGLGVAEQRERLARMRDLGRVGRRLGRAHACRSSNEIGACAGSSRALTTAQISSATSVVRPGGVDQHAALRLVRRERARNASRSCSWNVERLALEPVGAASPRRLAARAQADLRPARSRMKVRSGMVSPTTIALQRADQPADRRRRARPDRRGSNRRSGRRSPSGPRASAGAMVVRR